MTDWNTIGTFTGKDVGFKTFSHVGLKTDGFLAILVSGNGETVLWDIYSGEWLGYLPNDGHVVDQFLSREGFLNLNLGAGKGKYRVFGDRFNNPLLEHLGFGLGIAVDEVVQTIFLYSLKTDQKEYEISYTPQTNEPLLTSFYHDGMTIAIFESSQVTFFSRVRRAK